MNQSGENDIHLIVYHEGALSDPEAVKKLKTFRKFNTKNTDKFFHLKFWVLQDPKLAEQLGIKTQGDLYMLRQTQTPYHTAKPNVSVCDYPFTSEKLLTNE